MSATRWIISVVLSASMALLPSSAVAADLAGSITKAAQESVSAQARPNASGNSDDNPYEVLSFVLMGAGATVTVYSLLIETGVKCNETSRSFSCETTKNKTALFAGLGMIGVGAFLYHKGQSKSHPQILIGPRGAGVFQQLRW